MPTFKSRAKKPKNIVAGLWLVWVALLVAQSSFADDKLTDIYTFPDIPIKEFHNKLLPDSVGDDRKILLGSVGSDLVSILDFLNFGCSYSFHFFFLSYCCLLFVLSLLDMIGCSRSFIRFSGSR